MKLNELNNKAFTSFKIDDFDLSENDVIRLNDLGLAKGRSACLLGVLPFRSAYIIQVGSSLFSLRDEVARGIKVSVDS